MRLMMTAGLPLVAVAALVYAQNQERPAHSARMHHTPARVRKAVAVLQPIGDSGVKGIVHLEQTYAGLRITGRITGLEPGLHGFHVHEYGDLTDTDTGKSAGGHYNPLNMPHGRRSDRQRHVGDLGNIEADSQGVANIDLTDPLANLNGPYSILGRALVVHKGEDHFTQPSGNAGPRVAFGVIGVAENGTEPAGGSQKQPAQQGKRR
jgi:Cu-Zn family superoxide dismutase